MSDKKKLLVGIISLVLLIIIVKFGYSYLAGNYMPSNKESSSNSAKKKDAPDFIVYNEKGETIKLSDFKGKKPVVINIWASWCGPCKEEIPYFEDTIKKYGDDVEVLMINLTDGKRETRETALSYIKENNLNMKILFDEKFSAANAYSVQSIPRTIFVDKDGKIIKDNIGLINKEVLDDYIKKIIE